MLESRGPGIFLSASERRCKISQRAKDLPRERGCRTQVNGQNHGSHSVVGA